MKTFEELQLIKPIKQALIEEQYETPTPIQAQTIPPALQGQDILGCAQTGTGKTAAFALPILNRLGDTNRKAEPNQPFVLILAPTRELSIQIGESCARYARNLHIRQALVYGGVSQGKQVRALRRGVHLLIATPGRLLDLMRQGHIKLNRLQVFVLDEADRMLDMGFLPDIRRVIKQLPSERQSMFFSATLPPRIIDLSRQLLTDPVSIDVTPRTRTLVKIKQSVLFVDRRAKQAELEKTLAGGDVDRTLVFTRTKRMANTVAKLLGAQGITATAIHGNKSQAARQRALEAFRGNKVQVLVATDIAARGIDVEGVTHVVNYDMPNEPENYVHRIGRTGRAGAEGVAVSLCSSDERGDLIAIERLIGEKVPVSPDSPLPAPAPRSGRSGPNSRTRSGSNSHSGAQKRYGGKRRTATHTESGQTQHTGGKRRRKRRRPATASK